MRDSAIVAALASVELAVKGALATLAKTFRPGLSSNALSRTETQLLPYFLPEEVRALYLWHDGAEEPLALIPAYRFLSFEEALAAYRFQFELCGGAEGWNPLWFPIFAFQADLYCVTLSTTRQDTSPVYLSYNQDTELYLMYRDLRSLLLASAECFEAGAYTFDGEYLDQKEHEVRAIRASHGCTFPDGRVEGQKSISKHFTQQWPEEWRTAIGRTADDYVVKGANSSIVAYLRQPREVIIHARIVGLRGTSGESILEIEDRSGSMTAYCPRSAVGSRETQITRRYEMIIEPPAAPPKNFDTKCDAQVKHLLLLE